MPELPASEVLDLQLSPFLSEPERHALLELAVPFSRERERGGREREASRPMALCEIEVLGPPVVPFYPFFRGRVPLLK